MVREVVSWMQALSVYAYETIPIPKRKRKQGDLQWMLGRILVERSGRSFDSLVHLWRAQVRGYLNGGITAYRTTADVWILRQEDLVQQPARLWPCFQRLGLTPRAEPFAPTEKGLPYSHRKQQKSAARMQSIAVECRMRQQIEVALTSCDAANLVRSLGYTVPCKAVLRNCDEMLHSFAALVVEISSDDE